MISRSVISNAAGAANYHTNSARAAEYYGGELVPTEWRGQAAAQLGLLGKVEAQALTAVLSGRVIEKNAQGQPYERQLGRTVRGEHQHRAGYDFTISAPKSVSIEALVRGNSAVLEAHRVAVAEALAYLERHAAQARIAGEFVSTDGLAIATFEHVASRSADAQLHTHALIANVTLKDGKAYSLSSEKLFEHRRAADSVYHNALSRELQRAGLSVQHDREGRVEIAGYTREQLIEFSQRKLEIDAALAAKGWDRESASAEARNVAALATRDDKNLPEIRAAHIDRWRAQAQLLGLKPAQAERASAQEARRVDPAAAARLAVDQAKQHLTEREFVFKDRELLQQAARFSAGTTTQEHIEREIERQVKAGEISRTGDGQRMTTQQALAAERSMGDALEAGKGAHAAVLDGKEFEARLAEFETRKGFALSDEQRAAARMILTGEDRFQGVQGLAGTGKTTMLEFVREAAESKGWTVVGHSNGSEQSAKMQQESGIKSTTTASHLIEQEKALRDADLARRALETYNERPTYNIDPHLSGANNLRAQVRNLRDSQGNRYVEIGGIGGKIYSVAAHTRLGHQDAGLGERESLNSTKIFQQEASGAKWREAEGLGRVAAQMRINAAVRDGQSREIERLQTVAGQVENRRELRVMDEASQAGQREFNRAIATTTASGARTVFLGDKLQHQSVEAGRAFERAQGHIRVAELGEASIRRQTTEHMKSAVSDVLAKRQADAMARLQVREIRAEQSKLEAGASRDEQRAAAKLDNQMVIKQLAKDYAGQDPEQRGRTLIVTATNADRKAINDAVRAELRERGELGRGAELATLRKSDMSAIEAKRAENYRPGQTIQLSVKTPALAKGAQLEVVKPDSRTNTLIARDVYGKEHVIDVARTKVQAYEREKREFAEGDRIKISENHRLAVQGREDGVAVRNGQLAIVEKVSDRTMTLRLGEGEKAQRIEIERDNNLKAEHAYASTSHAAQGQTVDRVLIHHNTEGGKHGDRAQYVNITRAREDAVIYTQNAAKAAEQSGIELQKTSAHDVITPEMRRSDSPSIKPEQKPDREAQPEPDRSFERTRDHAHNAPGGGYY